MGLPDYRKNALGTAIVWGESGATGGLGSVTKTLSLDALAAAAGRMGEEADLGSNWDQEYLLIVAVESGTAPTAGGLVDVYLAWSHDGTNYPGTVTGSDGAYTVANAPQLGLPAYSLPAINSGNAVQQGQAMIVRAKSRYVAPVLINNWSQAIRNETTNSDNDSRVLLIPLIESVEE